MEEVAISWGLGGRDTEKKRNFDMPMQPGMQILKSLS